MNRIKLFTSLSFCYQDVAGGGKQILGSMMYQNSSLIMSLSQYEMEQCIQRLKERKNKC